MEISRLALFGRSDLEIAGQLGCDVRTLRRHYQAELLEERKIREIFFEWGRLRFERAKNNFYVTCAQIARELDRALAGSWSLIRMRMIRKVVFADLGKDINTEDYFPAPLRKDIVVSRHIAAARRKYLFALEQLAREHRKLCKILNLR